MSWAHSHCHHLTVDRSRLNEHKLQHFTKTQSTAKRTGWVGRLFWPLGVHRGITSFSRSSEIPEPGRQWHLQASILMG